MLSWACVLLLFGVAPVLGDNSTVPTYTSYFFFTNQTGDFFDGVSTACSAALTAPIPQCPVEILNLLGALDYYTIKNDTVMDVFCDAACPAAFSTYRTNVTKSCANDPQPEPGFPSTYWVDAASSVFTQACLKDSKTGQYCTDFLNETFGDASEPDAVLGGYSTTDLCSECVVNLFKHQQSTPYSNYDPQMAEAWVAIQSNCKLSYPTATPTLQTNLTSLGNYAPSGYPTASCVSNLNYTVISGDNCEKIAETNNASTGSLIALNSLYQDCSNLDAGQTICLPLPCMSYIIQSGDTCVGIANSTSTSFQQIISWNPSINDYCTNLIAGQNICVGPPGGYNNYTAITGATVTQTAQYATATAARPSPVATGTTQNCGKYYLVQPGDYCQLIALNYTIDITLFELINPQINGSCGNLLSGFYYCVLPTENWNSSAPSTIVAAPTTTPTGTTENCYHYYVIQSGDYCTKIEDTFEITFAQFQFWNPSLNADCGNLLLGEAYCVNGVTQPSATTSASSTTAGAKKYARDSIGPVETGTPEVFGGVAVGWPGLKAPRIRKAMGLSDEL